MEKRKFTYADPSIIEEKRIKEVRALSYQERLERLFAILESSRIFKTSKINKISVEDFSVEFLDYDSLIKTKQACNRPKDILDIEELEKINRLK
jgi:hypothetical protein